MSKKLIAIDATNNSTDDYYEEPTIEVKEATATDILDFIFSNLNVANGMFDNPAFAIHLAKYGFHNINTEDEKKRDLIADASFWLIPSYTASMRKNIDNLTIQDVEGIIKGDYILTKGLTADKLGEVYKAKVKKARENIAKREEANRKAQETKKLKKQQREIAKAKKILESNGVKLESAKS
jgi:hypothetical protein